MKRDKGGLTMTDPEKQCRPTTHIGERNRLLRFGAWLNRRTAANSAGFTFIEIMVVVAILAILAALVVPRIMGRTDDAKRTAAKVQIRNIEGALQLYKLDNGVYPTTEQGLKALIEKPSVGVVPKKWKIGGYLPKLPEDPWGNPYKYLSPVQKGEYKVEYEITSLGTDGEVGGEGVNADITNWNLDKE
ncbi:MAG TPA: type II secretion system major pseudopilin GspG [Nitrospira sp.]|nr:type II secretion system major pseudopilin GspG [Nitrospira sp.]